MEEVYTVKLYHKICLEYKKDPSDKADIHQGYFKRA